MIVISGEDDGSRGRGLATARENETKQAAAGTHAREPRASGRGAGRGGGMTG